MWYARIDISDARESSSARISVDGSKGPTLGDFCMHLVESSDLHTVELVFTVTDCTYIYLDTLYYQSVNLINDIPQFSPNTRPPHQCVAVAVTGVRTTHLRQSNDVDARMPTARQISDHHPTSSPSPAFLSHGHHG